MIKIFGNWVEANQEKKSSTRFKADTKNVRQSQSLSDNPTWAETTYALTNLPSRTTNSAGLVESPAVDSAKLHEISQEFKRIIEEMPNDGYGVNEIRFVIDTIVVSEDNWEPLVETPVGVIKMGGGDKKTRLFVKQREAEYAMLLATLKHPLIILEEADKEPDIAHERPYSLVFVKIFNKHESENKIIYASVTIEKEQLEISISSHRIKENQLKDKLKNDRMLYMATALDKSTTLSAEQPVTEVGSLSSWREVSINTANEQIKSKKTASYSVAPESRRDKTDGETEFHISDKR